MRRNPMPLENEYDVAITEPNGAALAQWIAAGIGRMFPEQYRAIAEIDACHVAAQEAQSANRRADKLRKRYYRQREEAEIAAHEPGATAYQRDRLAQMAETTRQKWRSLTLSKRLTDTSGSISLIVLGGCAVPPRGGAGSFTN